MQRALLPVFSDRMAVPSYRENASTVRALCQQPELTCHSPSDDAAPSPHEGNATIIEGPAKLHGCLSEQHKALRVGDDLGSIQRLEGSTTSEIASVSGAATHLPASLSPRGDPREGDRTRKG